MAARRHADRVARLGGHPRSGHCVAALRTIEAPERVGPRLIAAVALGVVGVLVDIDVARRDRVGWLDRRHRCCADSGRGIGCPSIRVPDQPRGRRSDCRLCGERARTSKRSTRRRCPCMASVHLAQQRVKSRYNFAGV